MKHRISGSAQPTEENLVIYDEFLARTRIDRLQKILVRYDLLKKTQGVPGDIVECGVFKGSGIYTLAKITQLLMPHQGRKIIGFDFFEAPRKIRFKARQDKKILDAHKAWQSRETILENLSKLGISNVELVAGNVVQTTKTYVKEHLGFRIALLYLDVDNYEGTISILKNLFPKVTKGGIVVFDEYAKAGYGESDAVEEYFKGKKVALKTLPLANTPSAYLVKE